MKNNIAPNLGSTSRIAGSYAGPLNSMSSSRIHVVCPDDAGSSGGQKCLAWAKRYFKDCVCTPRDKVSFVLGVVSILCWAVAEVPQIVTNCREQFTEGISLSFLMTWVLGDCFNLLGCYLEPSTLPTQFYMALLYTITTLILVFQVVYYGHYLKWRKSRKQQVKSDRLSDEEKPLQVQKNVACSLQGENEAALPHARTKALPVQPRWSADHVAAYSSQGSPQAILSGQDRYYTSARSLASSRTPTAGSYLTGSRGAGGSMRGASSYSLLQQNSLERYESSNLSPSNVTRALRAVVFIAMFAGGFNIHEQLRLATYPVRKVNSGVTEHNLVLGRKLLEVQMQTGIHSFMHNSHATSEASGEGIKGSIGVWLGWFMAAIYMGGRFPQIWLNIKRGTVEGLNPLMFTFALLGNLTYVGSILVRTTEWEKIKSNMPWLVDAGACVVLDFFILCQFLYYYTRTPQDEDVEEVEGDYKVMQ